MIFKTINGGLSSSSHAEHHIEARKSLDELLDEAATAGLRLLPGSQSADILEAGKERSKGRYMLQVKVVVVMDGKGEGVCAWILLGTFSKEKGEEAYTLLDLGWRRCRLSSQTDDVLEDGDHTHHLEFSEVVYALSASKPRL
ncbi:Guanosine-diphosphatase [Marasmius crinis-equi]|uniref:Guanosine-diphosphatase n=1 Tax=Marasmius crinis-equi TaxID=585013 RepID=A0ABR3ET60_9AGAR